MAEHSKRRKGEIARAIFGQLLKNEPKRLTLSEMFSAVENNLVLTEFERADYPNHPGIRRFENIARFATISSVKAGWLIKGGKDARGWKVTPEGRKAYEDFSTPEKFMKEAGRLYRLWKKKRDAGLVKVKPRKQSGVAVARSVWLEMTKSHGHGGKGWEFEKCLWSPTKNEAGTDYYGIMRQPKPGDVVLHSLDSEIVGRSEVKTPYRIENEEPPLAGEWEGRASYYRIDLTGYKKVSRVCPLGTLMEKCADDIREDVEENTPTYYPFHVSKQGQIRTNQGRYLSQVYS